MALGIDGYNDVFRNFADFAQKSLQAGDEKAIATVDEQQSVDGRKILTVTNSFADHLKNWNTWTRRGDAKSANDLSRQLFRDAVASMFGGESKIPESVKKAMVLGDYDSGKPLTARRILVVKAAIDADGTTMAQSAKIRLETFSPEVERSALNLGFHRHELPRLARAAHFYAQATGLSELEAMIKVAEPGAKANRLMSYGGRFMENAENFADGLRLMDLFEKWHGDLCTAFAARKASGSFRSGRNYSDADSLSLLNADGAAVKPETRTATEKFVFEQLAFDPNANLKEENGEAIFGFGNNDAARFIGQDFGHSCLNTIGNIPPAKRAVVFKAFNIFCTLATNAQEAKAPLKSRLFLAGERTIFLGRILRHLDGVIDLDAKGRLDAKNLIKLCFPDMVAQKKTGNYDCKAIQDFLDEITTEIDLDEDEGGKYVKIAEPLHQLLESAGATLQEAVDAMLSGKHIPSAPYVSGGQQSIEVYGTLDGGRKQLEEDLDRPLNYGLVDGKKNLLPQNNDTGFGFTFPGAERFVTNYSHKDNIKLVGDKIEQLCGPVHEKQASSVMLMVSQSGVSILRGGLVPYGIVSNEHSAVDFSISKDATTGAVTIKYTSPAELPFRFEWTATVDTDGKVTTTPLKFEKPVEMNVGLATKYVEDAAKALGVKLSRSQKQQAVALLVSYGTDMYEKNARIFAKFIVRLRLTDDSAQKDLAMAADTAKSIRKWRSFEFGDSRLVPFENAAKDLVNSIIREYMDPGKADKFVDNIQNTMIADANRGTFILGGTTYDRRPVDEVISAFKDVVRDPKARKALSSWMNQVCFTTILPPSNYIPLNTGVAAHELPGADAIANRNMLTMLYMAQLVSTVGHGATHDLQISEDGTTATITQKISGDFAAPQSSQNEPVLFGSVLFTQRLVIDLTQDIPTVVDYKLSQAIA